MASQLPVKSWHQNLDEPIVAELTMDRLLCVAHKIELKRETLRKKSKE
ncbi:MAG: ATP-binding protein [Lentimicrobium sp.]